MESVGGGGQPSHYGPGVEMEAELIPRLVKGKIIEVTDVGVKIALNGRLGVLSLPLRLVITDKQLRVDDEVEIYVSYARVIETKMSEKERKL